MENREERMAKKCSFSLLTDKQIEMQHRDTFRPTRRMSGTQLDDDGQGSQIFPQTLAILGLPFFLTTFAARHLPWFPTAKQEQKAQRDRKANGQRAAVANVGRRHGE